VTNLNGRDVDVDQLVSSMNLESKKEKNNNGSSRSPSLGERDQEESKCLQCGGRSTEKEIE
jgi:hypothetical protein